MVNNTELNRSLRYVSVEEQARVGRIQRVSPVGQGPLLAQESTRCVSERRLRSWMLGRTLEVRSLVMLKQTDLLGLPSISWPRAWKILPVTTATIGVCFVTFLPPRSTCQTTSPRTREVATNTGFEGGCSWRRTRNWWLSTPKGCRLCLGSQNQTNPLIST